MNNEKKAVYMINGFLNSGKTQFIQTTIAQPYFRTKGTTLLLVCEEGEEEYDPRILAESNTILVEVDQPSDFCVEKLMLLDQKINPSRILVEWNGMWDFRKMVLLDNWEMEQQITVVEAPTFTLFYNNMRSLFAEMAKDSELLLVEKCDGMEKEITAIKRNLKIINPGAEIIFEDKNGELDVTLDEDLPYDVTKEIIEIEDAHFVIWYFDMMEHPERYVGRTVSFIASQYVLMDEAKKLGVVGRPTMTCCENDIQILGFPCEFPGEIVYRRWVQVIAKIDKGYFKGYGGIGPVLTATEVSVVKPPAQELCTLV